jgi:hypothetical protein
MGKSPVPGGTSFKDFAKAKGIVAPNLANGTVRFEWLQEAGYPEFIGYVTDKWDQMQSRITMWLDLEQKLLKTKEVPDF